MNGKLIRILVAGICALTVAACTKEVQPSDPAANGQTQQYYLSDFQLVRGTSVLVAEIAVDGDTNSGFGSARWFSFGTSTGIRVHNLVFLDAQTLESHILFPTNECAIRNATQFPDNWIDTYNATGQRPDEVPPTEWFVYEVITNDTNNDGLLNRDDLFIIAISDEDGFGLTELMSGISEIYGMEMTKYGKLVVTYFQSGRKLASLIDMNSKLILDTKELINLGEDVK